MTFPATVSQPNCWDDANGVGTKFHYFIMRVLERASLMTQRAISVDAVIFVAQLNNKKTVLLSRADNIGRDLVIVAS